MDFSEKSYAKQRFRAGNKRAGRPKRPAERVVGLVKGHAEVNSNSYRYESDDEGAQDGTVPVRSQGADFEELLQEADRVFAQASYRHRELRSDIASVHPTLASQDPQQELVLDLLALDASLDPLRLHELLDMDPELFEDMEPERPQGHSASMIQQRPAAQEGAVQDAGQTSRQPTGLTGTLSSSNTGAYSPLGQDRPTRPEMAANSCLGQQPGMLPLPAQSQPANPLASAAACTCVDTASTLHAVSSSATEAAEATDDSSKDPLLDELLADLTGTSSSSQHTLQPSALSSRPAVQPAGPSSAHGQALFAAARVPGPAAPLPPPSLSAAAAHPAMLSQPHVVPVVPKAAVPVLGYLPPQIQSPSRPQAPALTMLPTARPAAAAAAVQAPSSSGAQSAVDAELHVLLGISTGPHAPAPLLPVTTPVPRQQSIPLDSRRPAITAKQPAAPLQPAQKHAQSLDDFLASL